MRKETLRTGLKEVTESKYKEHCAKCMSKEMVCILCDRKYLTTTKYLDHIHNCVHRAYWGCTKIPKELLQACEKKYNEMNPRLVNKYEHTFDELNPVAKEKALAILYAVPISRREEVFSKMLMYKKYLKVQKELVKLLVPS